MLEIYKKFFKELESNNIDYCIYKGLSHLDEDLNGERGDIDILSNQEIISNFFVKVKRTYKPDYLFGIDTATLKMVMVDIDNKIRLGSKPFRPYFLNFNMNIFNIKKEDNIKILSNEDYIPLMFTMRVTSLSPKQKDLDELKNLIKNEKNNIDFGKFISELSKYDVKSDILNASSWKELQRKYKKIVLKNAKVDYKLLIKQMLYPISMRIKGLFNKILKAPPYKIRKRGYLVAFVGNDGAGKSSTIEFIENMDYFKVTGVKSIYFGNNQYVIPFLNFFMRRRYKSKIVNVLLNILGVLDKKIRAYIAKYYIFRGYIILADRYFYDEMMGVYYSQKENKNILKKIYHFLVKPRLVIKPEITFFLDVDPEIAYERKQDYSFNIVKSNIRKYREFLKKFEEVMFIDANQNQKYVIKEIVKVIYEKDLEINKRFFNK